jgi:hypothetical protein
MKLGGDRLRSARRACHAGLKRLRAPDLRFDLQNLLGARSCLRGKDAAGERYGRRQYDG